MISNLKLSNFQSHKQTEFDFIPGVTVITGESDVGKSAVLRGLKWVALNKPSGDSVRRHDSKTTKVELDDVTKMRSASKHQYSHDSKVYKALRSDVPIPISEHLKLSDVNFQGQHDTYFLIGDSPGHVARELNEVADLQVIDLSLKKVKQLTKSLKDDEKQLNGEIGIHKVMIEELSWVASADRDFKEIEKRLQWGVTLNSRIDELSEKLTSCALQKRELEAIPKVDKDQLSLSSTIKQMQSYDDSLASAIDQVESNQITIPETAVDILTISKVIDHFNSLNIREIEQAISNVDSNQITMPIIDDPSPQLTALESITTSVDTLWNTLNELQTAGEETANVSAQCKYIELQIEELLKSAGICPLCGGDT